MHVAIRKQEKMLVHSKKQAQIRALLFNKVSTKVLTEYSNYNNVFSMENAAELSEYTGINDHAIKLEECKQLSFGPIYSLGPVELETLKTYIKIYLAIGFIWSSKSPDGAFILFNRKPDKSFHSAWIIGFSIIDTSKTDIYCL